MKTKKKDSIKMLLDIFSLVLKINERTEYNCFFNLSPTVIISALEFTKEKNGRM